MRGFCVFSYFSLLLMLRNQIFYILAFCFLLGGCDCRRQAGISSILVDEGGGFGDFERQQEVLDRSLELLNSLEENPCLPEMPGAEKLVQTADRLNKWITDRPAALNWTPDESLLALEDSAKRCSAAARDVTRLLRILQGKSEPDQEEGPTPTSLNEERKQIVDLLAQLDSELKTFAERCEIADLAAFSQHITGLRNSFSNLDTIANLTTAGIRAFARGRETETRQFIAVAESLEHLASEFRIEGMFVQPSDIDYLKQRIWIRNISTWARGERQTTLDRVKALFDWTVRNIEIREGTLPVDQQREIALPQQYPWQSLLIGNCTAWDRAWIFMELLREQRIDSCILSVPPPEDPSANLFWAVGVLLDGEIHLFLPFHGLPIPGPGGLGFAESGELDFKDVATLSQVVKDDSLLRRLDLPNETFPLTADAMKHSTAHLLVTPCAVSQRMKVIEMELSGEQSVVLYTDSKEQRRLFGTIPNIEKVELWKYPFRTTFEQLLSEVRTDDLLATFRLPNPKKSIFGLWSGRILYFKGRITGQESAITNFQDARIPDRDFLDYRNLPLFQMNPGMEPTYRLATLNAIYWLGMASYETGSFPAAKEYWESREISGRNPWSNGVRYMLGRLAEREKDYEKAAALFERSVAGPSAVGNLLRAKWLRETR